MILISNVNVALDSDLSNVISLAAKALKTDEKNIISASLYRKSVDARHKNDVHFCCSFTVNAKSEEKLLKSNKNALKFEIPHYEWQKAGRKPLCRPVVVGFGPAGMLAALALAKAGAEPVVIERGKSVEERTLDVESFFSSGQLDTESNVQFGEGGAGTFSDGKLNTGIKDSRCRTVLEEFVRFGAPEKILIDAKPHIGTDILVNVVKNLRNEVIRLGGEIHFSSRLEDIRTQDGKLSEICVSGKWIKCSQLVLSTGHSARDTFEMLKKRGVQMVRKPFSMGVRIEHLQSDINKALYGSFCSHPALSAADYKLAVHLPDGRGVYTFCMCPGGEVINASSEKGRTAVNGMSRSARDGINANSAVLVNVNPADMPGEDVLAGCELQRQVESSAYRAADGAVPCITLGEFLTGIPDVTGKVKPTVRLCTARADFDSIFPDYITASLREGIKLMDKKLHGFADPAAMLTAPETRSSSPVRIVRGEDFQCTGIKGIYPCGEGAGYAGGIMSAATDGLKVAETVIKEYSE